MSIHHFRLMFMGQTRIREKWRNFVRRGGYRPSATKDLKNFADADGQWPPLRVLLVYPECPVDSNIILFRYIASIISI